MKKILLLSVFTTFSALAQTPATSIIYGNIIINPENHTPHLNTPPKHQYFASQQDKVCWVAENVPTTKKQVIVTEIFSSPKRTVFEHDGTYTESNASGTQHIVRRIESPNLSGQYTACWQFGHDDPEGVYTLQVQIDQTQFPVYSFEWKHK